jgi:hypothetical protein
MFGYAHPRRVPGLTPVDRSGLGSFPADSHVCVRLRPAGISSMPIPSQTSLFHPEYKHRLSTRGKFPESLLRKKDLVASNLSVFRDLGRWRRATAHPPSRRSRRRIQPEFRAAHPARVGGANQAGGTHPAGGHRNASSRRRRRQTQPEFAAAHLAKVDGGKPSRRRPCTHLAEGRGGTATQPEVAAVHPARGNGAPDATAAAHTSLTTPTVHTSLKSGSGVS